MRAARTGDEVDLVLARRQELHPGILDAGDLVRVGIDGTDHAVEVPGLAVLVLEEADVRAAVLPLERRPDERDAADLGRRRAGRRRIADRADPPAPVLGAVDARGIDAQRAPGVADLALPEAELVEARRLHAADAARDALEALLDVGGASDPAQLGGDAGLVVVDGDAQALHRLEDLELPRADLEVGRLLGRAARSVEGVLLAVARDREAAVHDLEVRIERGADAEVELALVLVAVEPVAVVDVAIARRGPGDRLGRLVDRIVVELREHRASEVGPTGSGAALAYLIHPAESRRYRSSTGGAPSSQLSSLSRWNCTGHGSPAPSQVLKLVMLAQKRSRLACDGSS